MARKTISGLYERNGIWHVDKVVRGVRIYESTGTGSREEAERYLIHRLEALRQQTIYGVRTVRTFRDAATRYLVEYQDQPSAWLTATYLEQLDPFIGELPLSHIDDETLRPFINSRLKGGYLLPSGRTAKPASNRTVNIALQRVVRVLNVCSRKWRDEQKRPWLDAVPMISMLDEAKTRREPYPLSWDEQRLLFRELPDYLHTMALFKANTGCREQEVCKLRWEWEIAVPELGTSVFLIPRNFGGRITNKSGVKNGEDRLVVLNDTARSVIESQRGKHESIVFPLDGRVIQRMNESAWRSARTRAASKWLEEYRTKAAEGFAHVRVHDLKHTFGRRLKAADVPFEDRQVLLGHKSGSVTTHYSGTELAALISAANKVSASHSNTPVLTILKRMAA
jgi:integrase